VGHPLVIKKEGHLIHAGNRKFTWRYAKEDPHLGEAIGKMNQSLLHINLCPYVQASDFQPDCTISLAIQERSEDVEGLRPRWELASAQLREYADEGRVLGAFLHD